MLGTSNQYTCSLIRQPTPQFLHLFLGVQQCAENKDRITILEDCHLNPAPCHVCDKEVSIGN
jgi:hypothetical protein